MAPAGLTTDTWRGVCAPLDLAVRTPDPNPAAQERDLSQFLAYRCYQLYRCATPNATRCWLAEDDVRYTGERHGKRAGSTHGWARGWFSPEVVAWLRAGRRGSLSGAMIIKELFTPLDPGHRDFDRTAAAPGRAPTAFMFQSWMAMVRTGDHFDGWLWNQVTPDDAAPGADPHASTSSSPRRRTNCRGRWPSQTLDPACEPEWRSGLSSGCARCHASASSHLTFASLDHTFLNPKAPAPAEQDVYDYGVPIATDPTHATWKIWREAASTASKNRATALEAARPRRPYERLPAPLSAPSELAAAVQRWTGLPAPKNLSEPKPLPQRANDHVVAQRNPENPEDELATDQFLTSDQCGACHTATSQLDGAEQVLKVKDPPSDPENRYFNVSPLGEWSFSMMALATRDPVFQAQLEWEIDHRKRAAADVQDGECVGNGWEGTTHTCYRCHGVMGHRQLGVDRPGDKFTHAMVEAGPGEQDAKYGALARDGVSCMACHRITRKNLDAPAGYTGRFVAGPRGEIYGPFLDDIAPFPMMQSVGIEPKGRKPVDDPTLTADEDADIIDDSALCGSCHNVKVPRLRVGECAKKDTKQVYEQTTYLEWKNSQYARTESCREGETHCEKRSCQECHMPETLPSGAAMAPLKIASVADDTFPTVGIAGSQNYDEVHLKPREPFARHTLVGLNLFVLEMFRQFPRSLGIDLGDNERDVVHRMELTQKSVRWLADGAATVEIGKITRGAKHLSVPVKITNRAGHKFPTGVGFRRAYIEFQVLDGQQQVLWASGRTSAEGVITDRQGAPLATELSTTRWEPHHEEITAENQVQIYEARHLDSNRALTSSFLNIWTHVKDNRLLPKGWQWNDPANYEPAPDPNDLERNRLHEVMPVEVTPDGAVGAINDDLDYGLGGTVETPLCGCDRLTYRLPLDAIAGAETVVATLYYQALPPHYLRDRLALAAKPQAVESRRLYLLASHLNTREAENSPIANWRLKITAGSATIPPLLLRSQR